jgi:hypothetical protein
MAEGEEDIELLIGVYSSEAEARAAIRACVRGKRAFPRVGKRDTYREKF